MVPTHANKKGTRYRYYVSQSLIKRGRTKGSDTGWRVPASDIESLVEQRVTAFLGDTHAIFGATEAMVTDLAERRAMTTAAASLAQRWSDMLGSERRGLLQQLVVGTTLRREVIEIAVRPSAIPTIIADDPNRPGSGNEPAVDDEPTITLSVPARLQRTGMEMRLLIEGAGGGPRSDPDRSLLRLLARAQQFNAMMHEAQGRTMKDLASDAGVTPSYFTRVLRLSFLAPDIVRTIRHGRQPPQLTAKQLVGRSDLSPNWSEQAAHLGIA